MTRVISAIQDSAAGRGITRLCHFTPSRNLGHIANDPRGILASRHLQDDEAKLFNPTDDKRLDGYKDHVCCSIQYPNAWYFRNARSEERLFPDWVVILIRADYLWRADTKFCPRNAAAESGRLVRNGAEAFEALFAESVEGSGGNVFTRGPRHPSFFPTDEQAEVLIPDRVERRDVIGIAVKDESQARNEIARLHMMRIAAPSIVIVPEFYDPNKLSSLLRNGQLPVEREHTSGAIDA